jgi:hypothetical protein
MFFDSIKNYKELMDEANTNKDQSKEKNDKIILKSENVNPLDIIKLLNIKTEDNKISVDEQIKKKCC